jgi:hypothetical protein
MPLSESSWLSKAEIAEYAKVSIATVDRAIRRGDLIVGRTKRNGLVRARQVEVDAWLFRGVALVAVLFAVVMVLAIGCDASGVDIV